MGATYKPPKKAINNPEVSIPLAKQRRLNRMDAHQRKFTTHLTRGKSRGSGESGIWPSYEYDSQQAHHLTLLPKPTKLPSYSSHAANTGDARYNNNTINNICTANTNNTGDNMDIEEGGRREEGKDR